MALPREFPIRPRTPVFRVVTLEIFPGAGRASNREPATHFEIELQRAPDSSGVPGTPVTIAQLSPAPRSGVCYRDLLALDGARHYYRFRHVRDGWTSGTWSAWVSTDDLR